MKLTTREIDILRKGERDEYTEVMKTASVSFETCSYGLLFYNCINDEKKFVSISHDSFRDLVLFKSYSIKEIIEEYEREILLSTLDPTKHIADYMIQHNILYRDWSKCTQSLLHSGTIKIVGDTQKQKPQIKIDEKKKTIVLYTQERVVVKKCQEGDKFDERIGIGLALSEWYSNNEVWKKMRNEMRYKKNHKLKYREYALKVYDEYFEIRRY